jgi:hypothetical protein
MPAVLLDYLEWLSLAGAVAYRLRSGSPADQHLVRLLPIALAVGGAPILIAPDAGRAA